MKTAGSVPAHGREKVPDGYPGADGHIQRVFRAELRNLQTDIGAVHHLRVYAVDLVARHYGVFPSRLGAEAVEAHALTAAWP